MLGGNQIALGRLDDSLAVYGVATGKAVPAAKPTAMKAAAKTAMPATPEITRIEPRGIQRGATTKLKLTEKNRVETTAFIRHIFAAGPAARLQLRLADGQPLDAEIARTQLDEMALGEGDEVGLRFHATRHFGAIQTAAPAVTRSVAPQE